MKILWTDGSAEPNPGPGGFAVVEETDGEGKVVALGTDKYTTNIRMEGEALLTAVVYADGEDCEIHTDSQFWVNVLEKWAPVWEREQWRKKGDEVLDDEGATVGREEESIKNLDLVKDLYELYVAGRMKLVWGRGHMGVEFNEMADKWAKKAREGQRL